MNKQKGFAPIIIVLITIFLIGGIFVLQYWWTPKGEVLEEVIEPEEVIKDETDDWKVYRNEEYGFEVKYPDDWNYFTVGGPVEASFYKGEFFGGEANILLDVHKDSFQERYEWIKQIIEKRESGCLSEKCSVEQFYKTPNECRGKCRISTSDISVAGRDGKAITVESNTVGFSKEIFIDGGPSYSLQLTVDFKNETVLDQMLFTFRFLE